MILRNLFCKYYDLALFNKKAEFIGIDLLMFLMLGELGDFNEG
jgi:hypothetical protein